MSSITNLLKIKTKSLCRGLSSVLEVCPSSSLMDCQVTVKGRSLRPSTRVRLETRLEDKEQYFDYRSVTELMTDSDGQFRTDIDSALPGSSYTGIHKSGPLWSLQRRPGAKYRLAPDDITKPLQYNLTLTYPDSPQVISTAQATKSYVGEGVRRVEVREGDLRGALFLPASPGPAIITIYGGINNGKIPEDRWEVESHTESQHFVTELPCWRVTALLLWLSLSLEWMTCLRSTLLLTSTTLRQP